MEDITLWQGDCLELMENIPDGSVDLVLTDPPYGTTQCKWDSVIPFEPMWEQIWRVTKPNAAVCLFGSEPFSSTLRVSMMKYFKYDWIWCKNTTSGFALAKKQPLRNHELISIFYRKQPVYNPIKEKRNLSKTSEQRFKYGFNSEKGTNVLQGMKKVKYVPEDKEMSYPKTLKHFDGVPNSKGRLHPTQKPVALLEYLIKTYTLEGERVLDFTTGSGSTGVACVRTGRKFIGIEKDEKYFDIAENRITEEIYSDLF